MIPSSVNVRARADFVYPHRYVIMVYANIAGNIKEFSRNGKCETQSGRQTLTQWEDPSLAFILFGCGCFQTPHVG